MIEEDILEIEIQQEWIDESKLEAKKLGVLNNSIRGGEGNQIGFIGELAVIKILGYNRTNIYESDISKYHYDMIDLNGRTIDIKTKECVFKPRIDYAVCVYDMQVFKQNCQHYIFVRVDKKLKYVWILGWLDKIEFFEKAKFCIKGERDPDDIYHIFEADCWNCYIWQLRPISELNSYISTYNYHDVEGIKEILHNTIYNKKTEERKKLANKNSMLCKSDPFFDDL